MKPVKIVFAVCGLVLLLGGIWTLDLSWFGLAPAISGAGLLLAANS
jgi:hypothetical protein